MTSPIHVLGISGSLRRASWNTGLLHAAGELLPEGMSLEIADLADVPLYNQDHDGPAAPEAIKQFKERIRAADALLIATPEYNGSIPGVLKNAIDWASRPMNDSPLAGKPLAIMGAGGIGGTIRAQLALPQHRNQHTDHQSPTGSDHAQLGKVRCRWQADRRAIAPGDPRAAGGACGLDTPAARRVASRR